MAILRWFDYDFNRPICWLSGRPGSGKSRIAHTVALSFCSRAILAASFFFSRQTRDRSARHFISTLAYQLSSSLPQTAPYFKQLLLRDPSVVYQDTEHQFQKLILDPILSLPQVIPTRAIVVDALDECDDVATIGEFIRDITLAAIRTPHFPVKFFFTSRMDEQLSKAFCSAARPVTHSLSLDDIDSHSEISMFYRKCFNSIYQRHPRLMENIPLPWPSPSDLEQLVDLSRGSLLFALKIVDFVTNGNQLPSENLKEILRRQGQVDLE